MGMGSTAGVNRVLASMQSDVAPVISERDETNPTNRVSIYQKTARGETSRMNLENANPLPKINVDIQTAFLNPKDAHKIINSANLENLDERSEIAD